MPAIRFGSIDSLASAEYRSRVARMPIQIPTATKPTFDQLFAGCFTIPSRRLSQNIIAVTPISPGQPALPSAKRNPQDTIATITGITVQHLGLGTLIVAAAGAVNAALGWYLVRTGRKTGSLIIEANGKYVLTDSWTSAGVVGGLLLVIWTGWKFFDPLLAIAMALNILWSGGALVWRSVSGLMDYSDPGIGQTPEGYT